MRGSVYVDVEAPDFRRARLALSGVIVSALPAPPAAPARLLADVTPFAPTTERTFTTGSIVTTFLRAYQGGSGRPADVVMTAQILDATGSVVVERTDTLGAAQFAGTRSAPYQFRLPLDRLTPGEYLLTLTAGLAGAIERRDVTFQVLR
jgi:hypothetical protein